VAVVKIAMLVFAGGALGAMLREFAMTMVPKLTDNFPLDILVANLLASFLLGLVTGLHRRKIVSERAEAMLGTGVAGGLSTFSSFAYGSLVLMSASTASAVVASAYVVTSLVLGYIAVAVGLKVGQGSDRVSRM
jgi:fluoride exporter